MTDHDHISPAAARSLENRGQLQDVDGGTIAAGLPRPHTRHTCHLGRPHFSTFLRIVPRSSRECTTVPYFQHSSLHFPTLFSLVHPAHIQPWSKISLRASSGSTLGEATSMHSSPKSRPLPSTEAPRDSLTFRDSNHQAALPIRDMLLTNMAGHRSIIQCIGIPAQLTTSPKPGIKNSPRRRFHFPQGFRQRCSIGIT